MGVLKARVGGAWVPILPGPAAPEGGAVSDLTFDQASPSAEWIINHNFGFYPNVDIFTVGGMMMLGQVANLSANQVRVYFITPVAGTARLT